MAAEAILPAGPADGGGSMLGPYRLVRELGRGGQAVVWLAEEVRLRRPVALKLLEGWSAASEEARKRFWREAAAASKLDHPGICTVYASGTEGPIPWIAMRYVEGETLAQRIRTTRDGAAAGSTTVVDLSSDASPVPPDAADGDPAAPETAPAPVPSTRGAIRPILRLIVEAARALHFAHESGIVHRDVKPGNIMVAPDGRPVILDFGLARFEDENLTTLTRTGDIFGTPAYLSLEQLMAHRVTVDRRTDVYSLGVTLYECLTLRRPFEEPTRQALYRAISSKEPPDPKKLNPAISSDLNVDPRLESMRDPDLVRKLPPAERKAWTDFWVSVETAVTGSSRRN